MLTLYISIELFSFTSFFLILIKENKLSSMNAFIYFIFNTISSIIILLYFFIIYKNIGSLNFSTFHFFEGWASPVTSPVTSPVASPELINLFTNSTWLIESCSIEMFSNLFFLGFLLKLGLSPFHFWILSLYDSISPKITFYISTIPKILYFFIILKFIFYIYLPSDGSSMVSLAHNIALAPAWRSQPIIFLIFILLSLIFGSFLGINNKRIIKLFASSSITNTGFILLYILTEFNNIIKFSSSYSLKSKAFTLKDNLESSASIYTVTGSPVPSSTWSSIQGSKFSPCSADLLKTPESIDLSTSLGELSERYLSDLPAWFSSLQYNYYSEIYSYSVYHYIILYLINIYNFFFILLIFYNFNHIYLLKDFKWSFPFLSFIFFISILSFIGIPPLSGFFNKFYLFINCIFSFNIIIYFLLFLGIIISIINTNFYLYFIKFLLGKRSNSYKYSSLFIILKDNKALYPKLNQLPLTISFLFILFYPLFSSNFFNIINIFLY